MSKRIDIGGDHDYNYNYKSWWRPWLQLQIIGIC